MAKPTAPRGAARKHREPVAGKLLTEYPELVAQLHPTLNGDLDPASTAAGSGAKACWTCPEGPDHEWWAAIIQRTAYGCGCPCCAGRQPSVTNSLAALHPDIAAELHPTLNGGLTAAHAIAGSGKKVWWKCPLVSHHEWLAAVDNRTRLGSGCPHCSLAGRSKFELRFIHLIRAYTGLDVVADVKVDIPGHTRRLQVDLLIAEIGFLIDLDPGYWHQDAERDQRKLDLLARRDDRVYIRVREIGAPRLRGNVVEAVYCPKAFVEALHPLIEAFVPWRELTDDEVNAALAAADAEWSALVTVSNEQFATAA